ncbi:MAG: gliding motility-associated C-terminal domain-containing protein, partial [Bacteroidia bacterium]
LLPNDDVVLTPGPDNIRSTYHTPNPDNFINVSLPSYTNTSGVAVLLNTDQSTIDRFSYTESMHFPLLNDVKGVSLERINPNRPTQDATNWHSTSQNVGFATPGYRNSQYSDSQPGANEMTIDPEIFSPDNDGYNDVANIHFNFESQGYVATVTIYDSRGRLVRRLTQNVLLGTSENTISWDGINEKNEKAPVGVYIVLAEAFNATGETKKLKKTVVLATRFN